jgi:hypothetical protein
MSRAGTARRPVGWSHEDLRGEFPLSHHRRGTAEALRKVRSRAVGSDSCEPRRREAAGLRLRADGVDERGASRHRRAERVHVGGTTTPSERSAPAASGQAFGAEPRGGRSARRVTTSRSRPAHPTVRNAATEEGRGRGATGGCVELERESAALRMAHEDRAEIEDFAAEYEREACARVDRRLDVRIFDADARARKIVNETYPALVAAWSRWTAAQSVSLCRVCSQYGLHVCSDSRSEGSRRPHRADGRARRRHRHRSSALQSLHTPSSTPCWAAPARTRRGLSGPDHHGLARSRHGPQRPRRMRRTGTLRFSFDGELNSRLPLRPSRSGPVAPLPMRRRRSRLRVAPSLRRSGRARRRQRRALSSGGSDLVPSGSDGSILRPFASLGRDRLGASLVAGSRAGTARVQIRHPPGLNGAPPRGTQQTHRPQLVALDLTKAVRLRSRHVTDLS